MKPAYFKMLLITLKIPISWPLAPFVMLRVTWNSLKINIISKIKSTAISEHEESERAAADERSLKTKGQREACSRTLQDSVSMRERYFLLV